MSPQKRHAFPQYSQEGFAQEGAYEDLKEEQKLGTRKKANLGTGNNEQTASRKLWDACPVWVGHKRLEGRNDK